MRFLFFIALVLLGRVNWACDICTNAFEIIPNERRSSFGFFYSTVYRFGYPGVQTKHSGHLNYIGSEVKEIYNIYDLRYRHAFSGRFFGDIIVPLRNTYFGLNKAKLFDRWGLGDIQFQATYRLINPTDDKKFNHRVDITIGGDIPSGSWTDSLNQIMYNPVYQFGSGSFDFWASLSYVGRIGMLGYSLNSLYRRNTRNPLNFKFGDAINAYVSFFFVLNFKQWRLMPRSGVFFERGEMFRNRGVPDLHSGEQMISIQNGFSIFYKRFQLNGLIRNVLNHQTNGVEVRQRYFGQFALIYNF
jgi:hypothetical protein